MIPINPFTERGRIGESERKTERLALERENAADRKRRTEHALDQGRRKLGALKVTLGEDERKKEKLEARLRELSGVLEKVRQVEDAEAEVKRLEDELSRLPAEPEKAVRALQEEQEQLVVLAHNIAVLERLHQDRSELTKVVAGEKIARAEEANGVVQSLATHGNGAFHDLDLKTETIRVKDTVPDDADPSETVERDTERVRFTIRGHFSS